MEQEHLKAIFLGLLISSLSNLFKHKVNASPIITVRGLWRDSHFQNSSFQQKVQKPLSYLAIVQVSLLAFPGSPFLIT